MTGDLSADTARLTVAAETAVFGLSRTGPWAPEIDITFVEGAETSGSFFVRGLSPGTAAVEVFSVRLGIRQATFSVGALILVDGFDAGDAAIRLGSQWDDAVVTQPAQVSLSVEGAAAHRAAGGLRFIDGNAVSGAGIEARLAKGIAAYSGNHYVRSWIRIAPTSPVGETILISIWRDGTQASYELNLRMPAGTIDPNGFDQTGAYLRDQPTGPVADGVWHLIEMAVRGLGTGSGERALWLDGQRVSRRTGIGFTGQRFSNDNFGAPWSDDLRFTGTIDFDDVRIGASPLASRLALSAGKQRGRCAEVAVALMDSVVSAEAEAPYPVVLTVEGAIGGTFSDAGCSVELSEVTIPRGARSLRFFVASPAPTLTVSHPDFLPADPLELGVGGCSSGGGTSLGWGWLFVLALMRKHPRR